MRLTLLLSPIYLVGAQPQVSADGGIEQATDSDSSINSSDISSTNSSDISSANSSAPVGSNPFVGDYINSVLIHGIDSSDG